MLKSPMLLCLVCITCCSIANPLQNKYRHYLELDSVKRFREYIRIDTSLDENIKLAVDFWKRQAEELGLSYAVHEPAGNPIFVATWEGTDPSLPSIMLNSHMDVVKADKNEWTYPPFDAHMDSNGDIYGRGTQDTKDVGIQYLEAIRRLKNNNVTLARTFHITLMPDEESGGDYGMKAFVKTEEFKSLNIGFALDEGLTSTDENLYVTYVDRRPWQMNFVFHGEGGHGYMMPNDSAAEKAQKFINTVMAFRETQKQIMRTKDAFDYSGFIAININMINGGLAPNIIPSTISLVIDMRLPTDADADEVQSLVYSWMKEAGNDTEVSYIRRVVEARETAVDDSNPYWVTMKKTINSLGVNVTPQVCPATTDMVPIRNLGIPALGFSTKMNTIARLHSRDEYQNVQVFLRGIDIYSHVIQSLGNLQIDGAQNNSD